MKNWATVVLAVAVAYLGALEVMAHYNRYCADRLAEQMHNLQTQIEEYNKGTVPEDRGVLCEPYALEV